MGTAITANLTAIALLIASAAAYTNHTVGGDAGWFFESATNTSATDYSSWAANQTFSLGDYLIFKTNSNQTVIQTYNKTTYQNCDFDNASDNDTFQYGGGGEKFGEALTTVVALTIEGANYFFSSGGEDGVQCQHGMAFDIKVAHGAGLPPSLNQPPPPPYIEPPGPDSAQSPPGTVVIAQPPGSGGFGIGTDVRGGLCALLLLLLF
ncbi:hypothetical protein L484_024621 [Morus notabilis]|uniref:Phytocyanin domain-containing protein n=1 Tax=Morus notabilis TaxID=981085 RepID=W9RDS6_9ROSA|nr:uclacyanin-2 [Morus notabilis]EXB52071.1 hypothetical protein L484_024621 [Morus notabilis]